MARKELREKRVAQGMCAECGGTLDTDRYTCSRCLERNRKKYRETKRWYVEHGICPICRKENIFGEEESCPECRAKHMNKHSERLRLMTEEEREEYKTKSRERSEECNRKRYRENKEKGICVRCNKRKAQEGRAQCSICLAKERRETE